MLPLLYQHLILKNENVLRVLGRLLDEPAFGKFVRELHILSNLPNIRYRPGFFDKLEEVIVAGSLPHMHTLNIGSLFSWSQEGHYLSPGHLGKPSADLKKINLRKNCPRLRGLILRGISDDREKPYIDNCGVFEIQVRFIHLPKGPSYRWLKGCINPHSQFSQLYIQRCREVFQESQFSISWSTRS